MRLCPCTLILQNGLSGEELGVGVYHTETKRDINVGRPLTAAAACCVNISFLAVQTGHFVTLLFTLSSRPQKFIFKAMLCMLLKSESISSIE